MPKTPSILVITGLIVATDLLPFSLPHMASPTTPGRLSIALDRGGLRRYRESVLAAIRHNLGVSNGEEVSKRSVTSAVATLPGRELRRR